MPLASRATEGHSANPAHANALTRLEVTRPSTATKPAQVSSGSAASYSCSGWAPVGRSEELGERGTQRAQGAQRTSPLTHAHGQGGQPNRRMCSAGLTWR